MSQFRLDAFILGQKMYEESGFTAQPPTLRSYDWIVRQLSADQFSLPFSGQEFDRASVLRKNAQLMRDRWADSTSRILVVRSPQQVPLRASGGLSWLGPSTYRRRDVEDLIFLGLDPSGRALFAVADDEFEIDQSVFENLRDVALELEPIEAQAAAEAVALATWHRRSSFCSLCGERTIVREAGHIRHCAACVIDHFPRTDVAVIMLVSDQDRCVLGRRHGSGENRWSNLAGFVEAGESPEAAVVREVYEEVGLRVDDVRYRGSQPWPFPASLMLAYEAHAPYGDLGLNEEHSEVRWFSRAQLRSGIDRGEIAEPSKLSAGGFLIMSWLAGS